MVKVVKISDETHQDLQVIQEAIIKHGTNLYPPEFQPILESFRDKASTYQTIMCIAVKHLRNIVEMIEKKGE